MRYPNTPEEEATFLAMWQGILLVIVPGLLFVFGLIWLVTPPYKPPPQSWANGTYVNACCAPLVLRDGGLTSGNETVRYAVSDDKRGHGIDVARAIGVRRGHLAFGGYIVRVPFNRNSEVAPALHDPESLHLFNLDDYSDYVFVRKPD